MNRARAFTRAFLALAAGSCAGGGAFSQTLATHRLPAALAMEAANVAVSTCAKQGHAVSATVMDADAVAIAVLRGDGAPVHTVEASWQKAYAAASFAPVFGQDSGSGVAALIQRFSAAAPPGTLPFQTPEHMIVRAGGLTIKLGGEVLGAIGVGGAPGGDLDEACARAGLDAIRDRIK
jgi:uncharacterized protein GlcG (DUF336 family)